MDTRQSVLKSVFIISPARNVEVLTMPVGAGLVLMFLHARLNFDQAAVPSAANANFTDRQPSLLLLVSPTNTLWPEETLRLALRRFFHYCSLRERSRRVAPWLFGLELPGGTGLRLRLQFYHLSPANITRRPKTLNFRCIKPGREIIGLRLPVEQRSETAVIDSRPDQGIKESHACLSLTSVR